MHPACETGGYRTSHSKNGDNMISKQIIEVLSAMARSDTNTRSYLQGIADRSDPLLATIFLAKIDQVLNSSQAAQLPGHVAQEFRQADRASIAQWLAAGGAAQILNQ